MCDVDSKHPPWPCECEYIMITQCISTANCSRWTATSIKWTQVPPILTMTHKLSPLIITYNLKKNLKKEFSSSEAYIT